MSEEREQARRVLRNQHRSEPITLTNNLASAAHVDAMSSSKTIEKAAVLATLALAQEVRDLRLAMYGEPE